jgi:hypothetical protein
MRFSELRDRFGIDAQILCELELVMRWRFQVGASTVRCAAGKAISYGQQTDQAPFDNRLSLMQRGSL